MLTRRSFASAALAAALARPARAAELLELEALYGIDAFFSDVALAHDGRRVRFRGFMSPPLVAESRFYVLSTIPMSVCPFCDTESEWPNDILAVYAKRVVEFVPFYKAIEAEGVLRLGAFEDPETGFVSMVRLEDASQRLV